MNNKDKQWNDNPDYDEEDRQLDKDLYELIYRGVALPDGLTYKQAIGKALAAALQEEDIEDLIEIPSKETFDEWIRKGEERRLKGDGL